MRNTKLYIIAALVVLVVVIVLATILTNQFRNSQDQAQGPENQEKVETTTAKTLSRTERLREASRITKQSNTSLLSDDQIKRLDTLKSKVKAGENGMLTTEDFDIGYSDVTNQFYVQKKTDGADAAFEEFLSENNALDIFQTDLSLFIKTDQPLANYIKDQENYLLEQLSEENESEEDIQPESNDKNRSTDFDEIKNTFSEIIQSIYDIENLATLEGFTELSNPLSSDSTAIGVQNTPNVGNANTLGYYKMPTATNGEYLFGGWNTCETHKYGSKTLIDAIYTAALKWKAKYPQYTFSVRDLNGAKDPPWTGRGHSSHGNGVDVDIVTYGNWSIQIGAPTEVNIDLGKALIDTGVIKLIIFGGEIYNANAPIVQNAWKVYANSKGLPFQTYSYGNHDNHFHVRINDQYRLAEYRPVPCN